MFMNLKELYPPSKADRWSPWEGYPSYQSLIASTGVSIVWSEEFGSYQGDYVVIVKRNRPAEFGITVFGFGSCSGCDALEAANSYEALEVLRTSLYNGIIWAKSFEELRVKINSKDKYSWYDFEESFLPAVNKALDELCS